MKTILLLCVAILFFSNSLCAQNDKQLINEAKAAIDKARDYDLALTRLGQVSFAGKQDVRYFYYMAQAHEGINNYLAAVYYYDLYVQKTSLTPELREKIDYLRDSIKKLNEGKSDEEKVAIPAAKATEMEQIVAFEKAEEYKYFQSIGNLQVGNATKRKLMEGFSETTVYYSREALEATRQLNTTQKMNPVVRSVLGSILLTTATFLLLNRR